MTDRRIWTVDLVKFKGVLLEINRLPLGWYEIKVDGVPIPLKVHSNRLNEMVPFPKHGDIVEGEYDKGGDLWVFNLVEPKGEEDVALGG